MVNAIGRVRYSRNLTQDGRPSNFQVQRSMYYYGYGKPEQRRDGETRGTWYDQNGDVRSYGAALAWAKGTALRNKYTYALLLSVKDVQLTPEAFVFAMQQSNPPFSQWRLIAHDDTAYAHAHVIAFSNRTLPKRDVVGWSSRVRNVLEEMRHERIQRLDQPKEQADSTMAPVAHTMGIESAELDMTIGL